MFDFANNTFLAGLIQHLYRWLPIYQSLEKVIGVLFNLFGGVIADSFKRKKIIIGTNFLSGIACIVLSLISKEQWLVYAIVITNVILAFMSAFSGPVLQGFYERSRKRR